MKTPFTESDRILIVDDDQDILRLMAVILKNRGYSVSTAMGAADGIEMAVKEKPNLIILDVSMPVASGWEVLTQIRHIDKTRSIPVVMLTVSESMKDVDTAFKLGASAYIPKPINSSRILKKIDELLWNKKNNG